MPIIPIVVRWFWVSVASAHSLAQTKLSELGLLRRLPRPFWARGGPTRRSLTRRPELSPINHYVSNVTKFLTFQCSQNVV